MSNNLHDDFPILAAEWHPTKNGRLNPNSVASFSNKKVWWQCEKGHEWEAFIANRTRRLNKCPFCSGKRILAGFNDFSTIHPLLASQWHPTKNGTLKPTDFLTNSEQKIVWLCPNLHEFIVTIKKIVESSVDCCTVCNSLGFRYPLITSQWHPTKNGTLKPTDFSYGSGKKVWWRGDCGHEWQASPHTRTSLKRNCPQCSVSGRGQVKAFAKVGINDLVTLMPELAAQWHPTKNNEIQPMFVKLTSVKKIWWKCDKAHEWQAEVRRRVAGQNCPYCAGKKTWQGFNDLETTHPMVACEWHSDNIISPTTVTYQSHKKVWWVCDKEHEWEATVSDRTRGNNQGTGCPFCSRKISKAEKSLQVFLNHFNINYTISNRTLLNGKEVDFFVEDKKIAIEYNGVYWHSEAGGKDKFYHYNKWLECKNQGIQLIQIWEDDWNHNPELIKTMLTNKLGVTMQPKLYARTTQVVELNTKQAQVFLGEYHIQGFVSGTYYLGLVNKGDIEEIVAVLVLKKEIGSEGKTLNIIRYATSANVVGGFTKLTKHVEKTYSPERFITFSDNCVSDGGLYENNGFIADKQLKPDYMYVARGKRKHKFGYRLKKFRDDPELLWEEGLTEKQLAQLNNLTRIWDAGKTRWVKKF